MKKLILFTIVVFAVGQFAARSSYALESVAGRLSIVDYNIFMPLSSLRISSLSVEQEQKLQAYKATLPPATPDYYDLKDYQTSVKDQNPRGSCRAHAFIAALEAAYVRKYGLNRANQYDNGWEKYQKTGITNDCSLVCMSPDCFAGCREFDLSEEYHIHMVLSTDSTCNPNVMHENWLSIWYGDSIDCKDSDPVAGELLSANAGYAVPREEFAPYFGNMNRDLNAYGTAHGHNDLMEIAAGNGIKIVNKNGVKWVDGGFYLGNPGALTQQEVDDFEYDSRHIPLDARKHAIYGATSVLALTYNNARDTSFLEAAIADGKEVEIFVGLGKLDCGDSQYYDQTPVSRYPDGNPICRYPVIPPAFRQCVGSCNNNKTCLASCAGGLSEGYDANGNYRQAHHAMLIIGYDRNRQLFLLKNSWGDYLSYIWVPYQFIRNQGEGGMIIEDIRDPASGPSPEAMWIGKWNTDIDGHLGSLVIRRTRFRNEAQGTEIRMGTYYSQDGEAHMVTGNLPYNTDMLALHVDFERPEPPPFEAGGKDVAAAGQEFKLTVFYSPQDQFTYGNFAAGRTNWNNHFYGTLMYRQHINLLHTPQSFSPDLWKGTYRIFDKFGQSTNFEIFSLKEADNGAYYSVNCKLGENTAAATITQEDPNHLYFYSGLSPDLYYHTWERGIISGEGIFALAAMRAPVQPGYFQYDTMAQPILSPDVNEARPLAISRSVFLNTIDIKAGFAAFSTPVDIYLGISLPIADSEIYLVTSDLNIQPISKGMVPWRKNWTAPVDEKLFGNLRLDFLPQGRYKLYAYVVPAGSTAPGCLWETGFSIPWGMVHVNLPNFKQ